MDATQSTVVLTMEISHSDLGEVTFYTATPPDILPTTPVVTPSDELVAQLVALGVSVRGEQGIPGPSMTWETTNW